MTTAELIRAIVEKKEFYFFTASVLAVNQSERTCDCQPLNGDADIFGVRLQAVIDETTGIYIVPKQGSYVIGGFLIKNDAFIILCSEIESFEIVIGSMSFKMDGSKIIMNEGNLGGLVKIQDLVNKLNLLKSDINSLKTVFNSWVVVPSDGGAALKAIAATWSTSQLQTINVSDLENTKVQQ